VDFRKEYQKALADISLSLQYDPNFSLAYFNRSFVYRDIGDYERAYQDVLKAKSLGYSVDPQYLKELRIKAGGKSGGV